MNDRKVVVVAEIVWRKEKGGWNKVVDVTDQCAAPGSDELVLMIATRPDWVKYPPEVQAITGKEKGRVFAMRFRLLKCPVCGEHGEKQEIETFDHVAVLACRECGQYSWYRKG